MPLRERAARARGRASAQTRARGSFVREFSRLHSFFRKARSTVLCGLALSLPANAQGVPRDSSSADSTRFRGIVTRTDSTPISGADVWLVSRDLHATTDSVGVFQFNAVAPGSQLVEIRRLGYSALKTVIVLESGNRAARHFTLASQAVELDTVRTRSAGRKYVSPALQGFEERRLSGQGGYFISDSVLRANDYESLANIITSRMPGATLGTGPRGFGVFVSTRKPCRGTALAGCTTPNCFVSVYVDGALEFYPGMLSANAQARGIPIVAPPDLYKIHVSDLGGVEFYPGGASAPVSMSSSLDEGCGTLWLWTRER